MLKSKWTLKGLVLANAIMAGLVCDRWLGQPLWGFAAGVLVLAVGLVKTSRPALIQARLKLDAYLMHTLRLVLQALVFFALSAVLAHLVVRPVPGR